MFFYDYQWYKNHIWKRRISFFSVQDLRITRAIYSIIFWLHPTLTKLDYVIIFKPYILGFFSGMKIKEPIFFSKMDLQNILKVVNEGI